MIRAARQAAGLSQGNLASRIGVVQSAVAQWESGLVIPIVPLYRGLIGVLGPWPLLEALLPPDQAQAVEAQMPRCGRHGGIAESIRAARHAKGLTQPQVAARVAVRQSTVSQWERGVALPSLPVLRRLVVVLGAWPLLEGLLPADQADPHEATVPGPRSWCAARPSRAELVRLIVQEHRSDQQLAEQFGQPIGVILRWRRAYRLKRAAAPPTPDRPPRPSRQELWRLAIQEGRNDQELAAHYRRSRATIQAWRTQDGLARRRKLDQARLLALRRQGLPARQIAQQLGCAPGTVYRIAQAAGVQVAPHGSPPARRPRPGPTTPCPTAAPRRPVRLAGPDELGPTRNPEDGVVADHDPTDQDGLTAAAVAGLFGVSQTAVCNWADQGRLPFRLVKGQRRFPVAAIARLAHQYQVPLPDWLHPAIPTQEPM